MKAELTLNSLMNGKIIGANLLVLAAAIIVVSVLSGKRLPFLANDKVAFIALIIIGMTACSLGMGINARPTINWLHPFTIVSCIIGTIGLIIVVLGLKGKPVPFIQVEHSEFVSLSVIILLKWATTWLHTFLP